MERKATKQDEHAFTRFASFQSAQLTITSVIMIVIALGGIALAFAGRSLFGFAVLVSEVAGLVLAFLYGNNKRTG